MDTMNDYAHENEADAFAFLEEDDGYHRLATIRKGDAKGTGQGNFQGGRNLENKMRVKFYSQHFDSQILAERFKAFFEAKELNIHELRPLEYAVTDIPCTIPLDDMGSAFEFAYKLHLSYPLGYSDDRGKYWQWLRKPGSAMEVLVRDGKVMIPHKDLQGREYQIGNRREVRPHEPTFEHNGDPIKPKASMTLKVLLIYLGEVAHAAAISTSINDAREIRRNLAGIMKIAKISRTPMVKVPLVLRRRQREITKQYPNGSRRELEWCLSLEIDGNWGSDFLHMLTDGYFEIKE